MIILVPILTLVAGIVLYALASNPKIAELGRIAYAVGLFWTIGMLLHTQIKLFAP